MPKSITVNPADVRERGILTLPSIPLNQYKRDFPSEIAAYGKDGLIAMFHDMIAVREFESMLNAIKTTGAWNGVEYNHKGPAYLSIGQEAAVVGQAAALEPEDFIFGSHRSHGEILAKCYSASRKLPPASLEAIMRGFLDGETLRFAERVAYGSLAALAENFILFGTVAEIFARKLGFTRGLGGSMHVFFAPFGSMPNNAIVGGSADIATGAALFKRINRKPGIVVSNIGDASMGCGPVWEAMTLASMDQYRTLWPESAGGSPPHPLQLLQQLLRHGRTNHGRDHGIRRPREGGGWRQRRCHAFRACRRLRSSRRGRRHRAQEEDPPRGQGSRPSRHDHLQGFGPFPLGRLLLQDEG